LHFDSVNFRSEVWLNDTAVGMHEGGFTPFEFQVDDLLKFDGENTLMVRVVGPILMQDKRVDGMGPMETPQWRGAITGGIWQPVRLIATGDISVRDVFIEPNKATFFEGLYPVKLAYPDSREMAIREIQLAKDAGFNMIRPWRKPPPPMWLDLADEMGVLTVGSLAVECMDFPIDSASLSGWVENEVRESILRDRNRTCVVQWELFKKKSTKTSRPRTRSRTSPGNPSSRPSATTGSLITTCASATTSAPATPGGAPTWPSFPSAKAAASPPNSVCLKTSTRIPLRTGSC
jgi:beta-galactosidase/beta-glucuronidase